MDTIKIVRSIKRRTISIQINPDASITVTVPYLFPSTGIKKFLKEKEAWILQKQTEIKLRNRDRVINNFLEKRELFYLGKKYPLELGKKQKAIVEFDNKFSVASTNEKNIKLYLTSWYKQQARKVIGERVKYFSSRSGLQFKSLSITEAQTRWGSCSSDKNLHFNWRLVMAPIEVIDYVVVHELAHLEEMNHSRDFWEKVRKMFPIYRQYNTWLKRYGHTLNI